MKSEQADKIARAVGKAMWHEDNASQSLGMKLEEIRAGYARLSMPIRDDMTNGHKTAHGGFIFSLADSAFAFSCNSHNQNAVAQHFQSPISNLVLQVMY